MMEYWNIGILESQLYYPPFHYSIVPSFHFFFACLSSAASNEAGERKAFVFAAPTGWASNHHNNLKRFYAPRLGSWSRRAANSAEVRVAVVRQGRQEKSDFFLSQFRHRLL